MKYYSILMQFIDARPKHNLRHYEHGPKNPIYSKQSQRYARLRKSIRRMLEQEYNNLQAFMDHPDNEDVVKQAFLDNGFYFGADIKKGVTTPWCQVNLMSVFEVEKMERIRRVIFDLEFSQAKLFTCDHTRTVYIGE